MSRLSLVVLFLLSLSLVSAHKVVNVNFANLFSTLPDDGCTAENIVHTNVPSAEDTEVNVNFQYLLNNVQSVCTIDDAQLQAYCATRTFAAEPIYEDIYVETFPGFCRQSGENGRKIACVKPGGTIDIQVPLKNTGAGTWLARHFTLELISTSVEGKYWKRTSLSLLQDTKNNETGQFLGVLQAPTVVGFYQMQWVVSSPCGNFSSVAAQFEVTCSDGVFCNGYERFVNGKCVAAAHDQCDDSNVCTDDTCDEEAQRCYSVVVNSTDLCASQIQCYDVTDVTNNSTDCMPNCDGKECGDDGCGGFCGVCDDETEYCSALNSTCLELQHSGSCSDPIQLIGAHEDFLGSHIVDLDTSVVPFQEVFTCNPKSRSGQVIYQFTVPNDGKTYGIDARMGSGFTSETSTLDTCLELRKAQCFDDTPGNRFFNKDGPSQNVWCSDDATPPGGVGSRIATELTPGTYYIIAGGYSSETEGAAQLWVKFTDGYVPQCMSRWCGPDGGGGDCGPCPGDMQCNEFLRCVPPPNSSFCSTDRCMSGEQECGSDGCGGQCGPLNGACPGDKLCVKATGKCEHFETCDHFHPTCTGCSVNQYCGSDCKCYYVTDELPDVVPDAERLAASILIDEVRFDNYTCAWAESCIGGLGMRKLLRFDTTTINQGLIDLSLGDPTRLPNEYIWGLCHNHYHISGYAQYRLLDQQNNLVTTGHKAGYCMQDSQAEPLIQGTNVRCKGVTKCETPGLSRGFSDVYGNDIDCQWIDVTDVPSGSYTLRIELNVYRKFMESTYENNAVSITVNIP